ncbi:MAG: proline--tRNA ligase [Candidatus Riflebacteria bacterium RBG_13_59_9]|nr:MAG: proline--tRNA ligase [Candidatus Riflebacteria bacterium RBG_13_59_9]
MAIESKHIAKRSENLSEWYTDVILQGELADYAPVRGCMVYREYGYAIWERIKTMLGRRIRETGAENVYYPLFIPRSLLLKEAQHVAGFSPQVAWVTIGGGEKLAEPLAVRPTSEVIIGTMWAKWIGSYRDLPVLQNQWVNVVRWEKATRPFLRTLEFLWQEGHTAHRTEEEALRETEQMLDVYREFAVEDLSMAVLAGVKSESERFAGAAETYAIEAMMPDGKALQSGTSHFLGQNFAKAFDIKFLDDDNTEKYVWTTSWGVSHRIIGGMIMLHGDDNGLIMPPQAAPVQAIITPILYDETKAETLAVAEKLVKLLSRGTAFGEPLRVRADLDEATSPGFKFGKWELKGVPVRLEIGPKDLAKSQVIAVTRDERSKHPLIFDLDAGTFEFEKLVELLAGVQKRLRERAASELSSRIFETANFEDFKDIVAGKGFAVAAWDGTTETELAVKEATSATVRVLKNEVTSGKLACIYSGRPARYVAYWGQSY